MRLVLRQPPPEVCWALRGRFVAQAEDGPVLGSVNTQHPAQARAPRLLAEAGGTLRVQPWCRPPAPRGGPAPPSMPPAARPLRPSLRV